MYDWEKPPSRGAGRAQLAPSSETRNRSQTRRLHSTEPRETRILVVEDQEDVRRMLVTALEIEGHRVDAASNAADGLKRLSQARYNLVLSDYAMPGGTGTWMLHEASRLGLMDATVALIVTAHPEVNELTGVEVIPKPLDLDFFLEQVRRVLAGGGTGGSGGTEQGVRRGARRMAAHRVELVLYISSASPVSLQARRNLDRLLSAFDRSQVKFTVCDLVSNPRSGDADRIAFTPTLVKRYPEPRVWVLGNLKESDVVADLLTMCGVDARE